MNYQKTYKKQLLPAIISLCTLPLYAGGAIAQEESVGLEEIVVTARKRQESIQDVPVAVSAISGDSWSAELSLALLILGNWSLTWSSTRQILVPNHSVHQSAA